MSSVEQEHALAGRLAVRKILLKNNKSPLPAALHLAIQHFLNQNRWPVISAITAPTRKLNANLEWEESVSASP